MSSSTPAIEVIQVVRLVAYLNTTKHTRCVGKFFIVQLKIGTSGISTIIFKTLDKTLILSLRLSCFWEISISEFVFHNCQLPN